MDPDHEREQFWLALEKMVSRSSPDDPPEELRARLPPLPPDADWDDFGIDPDNIDYDDLKHTMRMMKRSSPRDRFFDIIMLNRFRKKQPTRTPATNQRPVYLDKNEAQRQWRLPVLVSPEVFDEQVAMKTDKKTEIPLIQSDAVLYRVKEQAPDGSQKLHSILKMMSKIPDSMLPKEKKQSKGKVNSTFNLFMGDVSASMTSFWPDVVKGWNTHIRPNLVGRTSIMTFGSDVTTKRTGNTSDCYEITQRDFDGSMTDLTGALIAMVEEIYKCKEKFINVFFVTDGGHNGTSCEPDSVIEKMRAPKGKICDVYVLGAGSGFPVQYSVDIRSRLHNGRANLPTIFWAKDYSNDMEEQMQDIAGYLGQSGSSSTIKLSIPGNILPFYSSQDSFHLNEYVYFDEAPEQIQEISLEIGKCKGKMNLETKNADVDLYLNDVFRQWNGMLIQIHNKKETVPSEIVPFMERLFYTVMTEMRNQNESSIRGRLASKGLKGYEVNFKTLMNTIKNILTKERFSNDLELAENILSTTVSSKPNKYTEKTLRMKGHTGDEFDEDKEEFRNVIKREMPNLMKLDVTSEDCCRVTITSTISDLRDEDFNDLLELNKYEFLKTFTISGIPIFSPLRDSAMINPWIYSIRRILKSPYTIMSQVVLENMTTANPNSVDEQNKGVKLQGNDEQTCFNAVIPVFPPNVASQMKNIMRTKIYAMCCTFAILKNPNIIDYNIHMAALGIAWVRMLYEHPEKPRPEHVQYRIECIEATAAQYSDRSSFAKYRELLGDNANQAIMTESTVEIDGNTLKCESLVKPMFILHLAVQAKIITDNTAIKSIVKTILIEYTGRCLSNNVRRDDPDKKTTYSDFFTDILTDQANQGEEVNQYVEETKVKLAGNAENLLEVFYHKAQCRKAAERAAKELIGLYYYELTSDVQIQLNKNKVNQLRNVSACGDVSWASLKTFSKEVGLPVSDIEDLFSDQNIFLYVAHGFKYTSSRERLETPLSDYNECIAEITKKVKEESSKEVIKIMQENIVEELINSWLSTYTEAHVGVVEPMTKSQIMQEARLKEINVNEENFDQIYRRYRPSVGLMGNACQSRSCPWFLKPMKTYNEHAAAERHSDDFPHGLHIASKRHCTADIRTISNKIVAGDYRRSDKITTHERLSELDITHLKNSYMQMDIQ